MRLVLFILTTTTLSLFATGTYSQNAKVTIDMKNASIRDVLLSIEKSSEFFFIYNNELIDVERKVDLNVKDQKIGDVLTRLFRPEEVEIAIMDRKIILAPAYMRAQQQKVTGTVTDASTGEAIVGANVVIEGTTTGTITDVNGTFSLNVAKVDAVILISYLGYNTERVTVSGQSSLEIKLVPDITKLDEVVVVGYGTQKKSDLTGSVSSVSKKDLGDRQVSSIAALIQGKASGVDVTQGKIRVRGVTTFNNSDPLIVIDGFLGGNLSTVNPNDIENIEILKDASSTAIYGSRGANGVILVTTKAGKGGPLKVNVNAYSGIAQNPRKLDVLNAQQYNEYALDALKNANTTPSPKLLTDEVKKDVTNWQDEIFRTAHNSEIDIDFSGGSEKGTYYFSMGYRKTQSIAIGPEQKDLYFRLVNDFKVRKWITFGNNFALNYSNQRGEAPDRRMAISALPYYPVLDPANSWGYSNVNRTTDMSDAANPVVVSDLAHPVWNNLGFQTNIWTEIRPFKGLVYRINAGASGYSNRNRKWSDYYANGGANETFTRLTESSSYALNPLIESYLTYSNKVGAHDFSLMAGNTWQNKSVNGGIGIMGSIFDNTEVKNVFNAQSNSITNQDLGYYAYLSYFGRLNYQFGNKYLLTANLRRDASPRFAPSNRWGTFPSVALGWKMHEENFMKNVSFIDQFKLRAGWGISGNDAIGSFRYLPLVSTYGLYYPLGSAQTNYVTGATIKENHSFNIKWEETEMRNFGFDMGILKNSLTLTFDYFIKDSRDILFTVPRSSSLGYGNDSGGDAIVNAASATNKGIEIQLGYRGNIGELKYSLNSNYTYVKNEVTSLGLGQPYLSGNSRTDVGNPIGYFYGYVADGIIKTTDELDQLNVSARNAYKAANPTATDAQLSAIYYQLANTRAGDVKYSDLNGDGRINAQGDRTNVGSAIPKHLFGLNISFEYANFDVNMNFQGMGGYKIMNGQYVYTRSGTRIYNQEAVVLNRWRSESEPGNGKQPRAVLNDPGNNARASSLLVENGDYLRLRQISLGYTLPKSLNTKIGINQLRVYVSSDNLFTLTKYTGYDPEIGGDNLTRGIDNYPIPTQRSFIVGIQLAL